MAWIETQVNQDIVLQRKNRLKGLALQVFVSDLINQKYDASSISGSEDSVEKIKSAASDVIDDLYNVKSTFRVVDDLGNSKKFYPQNSNHFDYDNYLLDLNEFQPPLDLFVKSGSNNSSLGYKGCSKCFYCAPKKFCKKCGGSVNEDRFKILNKIKEKYDADQASEIFYKSYPSHYVRPADDYGMFLANIKWIKESAWNEGCIQKGSSWGKQQWCTCDNPVKTEHYLNSKSKCPKCNSGRYNELRPGYSINEFNTCLESACKEEFKQQLSEKELVTKNSLQNFGDSRLDDWLISKDSRDIFIIETKNYEDTGLSSKDLMQVLKYVKAIRNSGVAKPSNADIIYNGSSGQNVEEYVRSFSDKIDTNLNLVTVKEFCKELGVFPGEIVISKDLDKYEKKLGDFKVDYSVKSEFVDSPKIKIML